MKDFMKNRSLLDTSFIRGGSRTRATFKMVLLVIIVNGLHPLTIITKCSYLDVAAVLDPPLFIYRSRLRAPRIFLKISEKAP